MGAPPSQDIQFIIGYLRINQILKLIPISTSTWWAGVKSGRFPSPIKLGPRATYWKKSDILILISKISHGELI